MFKIGYLQVTIIDEALIVLGDSTANAVEAHRDCLIVGDCLIV